MNDENLNSENAATPGANNPALCLIMTCPQGQTPSVPREKINGALDQLRSVLGAAGYVYGSMFLGDFACFRATYKQIFVGHLRPDDMTPIDSKTPQDPATSTRLAVLAIFASSDQPALTRRFDANVRSVMSITSLVHEHAAGFTGPSLFICPEGESEVKTAPTVAEILPQIDQFVSKLSASLDSAPGNSIDPARGC